MNLLVQNYENTQREVLIGIDRASFYEDKQMNETWEVGFDMGLIERNRPSYELVTYENSILRNGQEFVIKEMEDKAEGDVLYKSVVATHIYHTVQDGYQYDTISGTLSAVQCLNHIFAPDTRGFTFQVINTNGVISRIEQENFGDGNYLKLIKEVLADYDLILIPNNKHLVFVPQSYFGEKTNNIIRHKYNTDTVNFKIDTYNLRTQIMGFGKRQEGENGEEGDYYFEPLIYTSPEEKRWGIRIADPVRDERFTVAGNMATRLRNELQDYPEIVGSIKLKLPFGGQFGDYVRFVYEPKNINQFIQVVGIKEFPYDETKPPEINLSNTRTTMTSYMVALAGRE